MARLRARSGKKAPFENSCRKTPSICNTRLIQYMLRRYICYVMSKSAFVSLEGTQRRLREILETEARVNTALGNACGSSESCILVYAMAFEGVGALFLCTYSSGCHL